MSNIDTLEPNGVTDPLDSTLQKQPSLPLPEFDPEEFRGDIADLEMSKEQETEFLQTLWSIMGHFARLGYAVDVCGLIFEEFNEASAPVAGGGRLMSGRFSLTQ